MNYALCGLLFGAGGQRERILLHIIRGSLGDPYAIVVAQAPGAFSFPYTCDTRLRYSLYLDE